MTAAAGTSLASASKASIVIVALAIAAAVPALGSDFVISLVVNMLISGLLAMSLDLLIGYTGLVSLGHASFLGMGSYALAYPLLQGVHPLAAIGVSIVTVLVVAAVTGILVARVKDLTFAMVTLALGQVVWGLAYRWVDVSGGDNGLSLYERPTIGPFDLSGNVGFYYFVLLVFVGCAVLLKLLTLSPFGLSLRGIRDNESRMRSLGYRTVLHKYVAFVIAGLVAGVSGILFCLYNLFVNPTILDFAHNITAIQMVVLGGMGTLWGSLLGAGLITVVQQLVSIYVERWQTLLGIIFVVVVLFARTGAWGLLTLGYRTIAQSVTTVFAVARRTYPRDERA